MAKRKTTCSTTGHRYRFSKRSAWWRHPDRSLTASMEISIGNPQCSGSYLECMLLWGRKHFDHFVFSIGDTLRTHNYVSVGHPRHGMLSPGDAQQVALNEGDAWIKKNRPIVEAILGVDGYRMMRWEEWKQHIDFHAYTDHLRGLFAADKPFRDIVIQDLQGYLDRQGWFQGELALATLERLAEYLFEELAVYQIQAEQGDVVNIYPGGAMKVFKNAADINVLPATLRQRDFAYIDFSAPEKSAQKKSAPTAEPIPGLHQLAE